MGLRLQHLEVDGGPNVLSRPRIFLSWARATPSPSRREGALKVKECAYVHAEGLSGGAMKHGPFALISEDLAKKTPFIMLILDDEHSHLMADRRGS